jgi:hypothetical protein
MSRDDIQKLLGGYATGTLTPEEQQALFEAALSDQELFDELACEEALREVLADPAARAQLLAATQEAPAPWYRTWWRPMVVVTAVLVALVGVGLWQSSQMPKPVEVARVELPRFQPPVERPQAPALLPPPPQVKQALPAMRALPIAPAAAPVLPPPPVAAPRLQVPMLQSQQAAGQIYNPSAGNSFLEQVRVPLRGTVIDSTGAVVPSASVAVHLADGATVNTSTDARGEFSANAVPGSDYQVSVSKPGFRQAVVTGATPPNGIPAPVNVRLDLGAPAETVEVTASAESVQTAQARVMGGLAGAAPAPMAMKAAPAIVQYELLQRVEGGAPQAVPAGATVPAGSTLILRVTPLANGYLRIVDSTGTIANPAVRRQVASETVLPPFNQPGRVELQVYFSTQAGEPKQAQSPAATIVFNIQ